MQKTTVRDVELVVTVRGTKLPAASLADSVRVAVHKSVELVPLETAVRVSKVIETTVYDAHVSGRRGRKREEE